MAKKNKPNNKLTLEEKTIVEALFHYFTIENEISEQEANNSIDNKKAIKTIVKDVHNKYREYFSYLMNTRKIGKPCTEILKDKNIIEVNALDLLKVLNSSLNIASSNIFGYMPCFNSGVFVMNIAGLNADEPYNKASYICDWECTYIDEHSMLLKADRYRRVIESNGSIFYEIVAHIETVVMVENGKDIKFYVDYDNSKTFKEILSMVPGYKFGWSKFKTECWKQLANTKIESYSKDMNGNKILEENFISYCAYEFINYMAIVNRILNSNKVSRPVKLSDSDRKVEKVYAFDKDRQSTRKIRIAGGIKIFSEKVPKTQTKDTVMHYNVASWTTRGHMKRSKYGKVFYVRESVHHRRALKDQNSTPAPVTIKIQNP